MGKMIEFIGNGTSYNGYLAPSVKGSGPGVIVIHEWWGLVDHIKGVADRLAENGFTALAVDCYHGEQTEDPVRAEEMMLAFDMDMAEGMTHGAIDALNAQESVTSEKIGVVGFSMGGQMAIHSACVNSDIRACVTSYGVNPNMHPKLEKLNSPVMGIFAELDTFVFGAQLSMMELQLAELDKEHFFKTYKGAHHGFFNPDRPDIYDHDAAEDAWVKMLGFLHHYLG